MRALITNDDGIGSAGILVLAKTAVEAGLDVTVAAPGWDSSGASASLTSVESDGRLLVEERRLDDLDDVKGFAVEAAPAYIVRAGITGAFGPPPEVVLSGMNHGRNTGYAVLHSGTVGAALTAMTHGRPAMAVSIDSATPTQWGTAAAVTAVALRWLLDVESPVVLNVNVPDVAGEQLGGFRRAHLAKFGAVQTTLTEAGSGYAKFEYSDVDAKYEEGTDAALLEAGIATFTPLQPVCEASSIDTTSLENVPATASQR